MKNYRDLINEVASAQSPADKEFVALHKIIKKQFVDYPEHQFKGGVGKDHTKLSVPSNETGMDDDVEKEKPKQLGEWRQHLDELKTFGKVGHLKEESVDESQEVNWDHLKSGKAGIRMISSIGDKHVVHYYPDIHKSNQRHSTTVSKEDWKKHAGSFRSIEG